MQFASLVDMEPGQWFRSHDGSEPLEWLGVDPVVSRFGGKRRVRVLTRQGVSWVADVERRYQLINWERNGS